MKVLVTGADGFVGRHLTRHLREAGDEVVEAVGVGVVGGEPLDVRVAAEVDALVARTAPDAILHLAAMSSVAASHKDPAMSFAVNAQGTLHLVDAVRRHAPRAKVLLIGSGEVYGPVPEGARADESFPLRPVSPYAASKASAEVVGFQYARSYGLTVMATRAFNHLGRGQAPTFLVPDVARQIARMKRGEAPRKLELGNIDVTRDFSHVSDVVRAYRWLLERGTSGEAYNVCSGSGRTVRSLVERMLVLAGVEATIECVPERMRPAEIQALVGSPAKLEGTGWRAEKGMDDGLRDALESASA